jgi:hypothetical protein
MTEEPNMADEHKPADVSNVDVMTPEATTTGLTAIYVGTLSKGVMVSVVHTKNSAAEENAIRATCIQAPFEHREYVIDENTEALYIAALPR